MILASIVGYEAIQLVVIVLGLVLVGGLMLGQFRRGVVTELREALNSAQSEIEINRGIVARLETEMAALRQLNTDLIHRIHELENRPNWQSVIDNTHRLETVIVSAVEKSAAERAADQARIAAELAAKVEQSHLHLMEKLEDHYRTAVVEIAAQKSERARMASRHARIDSTPPTSDH